MATFTSDQILGDIVTADPSSTRILSRFGIDFCCHGQRSLADACASDGVDVDELLAALNSSAEPGQRADWADFDDTALIAHIVSTHHRFLWDEFPRLAELVDKVARVHGPNHGELARVREVFHQLRGGMEPHLRTEETMLFPEISLSAGRPDRPLSDEVRNELAENQQEHDNAGHLLAELRDLTDGYTIPADACASYTAMLAGLADLESDIHLHVHKENNVLFPRVLATANSA
ncbi:iron-sulfur cluster repair di-iron protein [[Mycobacterium] crassicus]|uniref:Iron-sulfur cluster repair di-iron protein n=1 Tax=[Mycobacterium] crassicus TaxID=2872309 RepID=A0ABU5XI13_9MYCO|nr:iron-sulfur cluster repair di-iron protein [Mycolicibacter sp. MYC098]MEB3021935.1 iron-sulfur cluster repair di-iron protein [Mycolicibacter sp. MYC098]